MQHRQLLECYMALGGVPFYWSLLKKEKSLSQNIDGIGKTSKLAIYQLVDFYTLFYFKFILENKRHDPNFWSKGIGSSLYSNWCGLAFERVCLAHVNQIKQALSIGGVSTSEYSWFVRKNEEQPGAQIDLLLDRNDDTINICEMKYVAAGNYALNAEEEQKILNRRERFMQETKTTKAVQLTLVTTYGLTKNPHADVFQNVVVSDSLFL